MGVGLDARSFPHRLVVLDATGRMDPILKARPGLHGAHRRQGHAEQLHQQALQQDLA